MTPVTGLRPSIEISPIPPAILEEIEVFEGEARRMLSGELSGDIFKPFRL